MESNDDFAVCLRLNGPSDVEVVGKVTVQISLPAILPAKPGGFVGTNGHGTWTVCEKKNWNGRVIPYVGLL